MVMTLIKQPHPNGKAQACADPVRRTQIAMACMILGIIFFGILLGSIAEALQVWSVSSSSMGVPQANSCL